MKLLAVDDNQDNLTALKAVLRDALPECAVMTTLSGSQAIELARAQDPDVILLDIVMPGMDGFEVCRRLKADPLLHSIPVVFLTALRTDRESRVKALEVGAEAFLSKPWDEQELVAQVRAMTKLKSAHQLQRMEKEELAALVTERTRELEQKLAERKRTEEDLAFLAHTSSEKADESFFRALARYLAQSLGMDFVCIDRLEGDGLTARTVAVWSDGHFEDNVTYALKDTPCGDVVGKTVCCFPASVCQLFPRDQVLRDLRAESYIGVTLWSHTGQPIGLIAVIGHGPLTNRSQAEATLELVAVRAAGEMERLEAEESLRASEKRYAMTLTAVNDGLWDWHVPSGNAFFSALYYTILGYENGEFPATYDSWRLLVHPQDIERVEREIRKCVETGKGFAIDFRMKKKTDDWLWISTRGKAMELNAGGQALWMVGTLSDITERKQAEEALQLSLREKVALLNEVHHRVKNNLQVITSLLRMEARRSEHPATKSVLDEMKSRILSMALLHESLYRTGTFAAVDLGAYLKQLTNQSFRVLVVRPGSVRLQLELASVQVEMDQAMPCGLLVNELISNCLKHGFPGDRSGEVRVELQPMIGGSQLRLRVSDTGVGLPADFEAKRGNSLGLQLVSSLARQIGGRLEVGPEPGAVFEVIFTPKCSKPNFSSPTP